MKRRQFLKSVFGAVAGLAVVPSVVKAKSLLRTEAEHAEAMARAIGKSQLQIYKDCESMLKEIPRYTRKIVEPPKWEALGCKECFRECSYYLKCQKYNVPLDTRKPEGLLTKADFYKIRQWFKDNEDTEAVRVESCKKFADRQFRHFNCEVTLTEMETKNRQGQAHF